MTDNKLFSKEMGANKGGSDEWYTPEDAAIDEADAICHVVEAVSGQRVPKCDKCHHYGCEAFRRLKAEQERYEEE